MECLWEEGRMGVGAVMTLWEAAVSLVGRILAQDCGNFGLLLYDEIKF